jgi:hypothetical protein
MKVISNPPLVPPLSLLLRHPLFRELVKRFRVDCTGARFLVLLEKKSPPGFSLQAIVSCGIPWSVSIKTFFCYSSTMEIRKY